MPGEPTAQLETPAAVTAVTSARKLLRVTYTGSPVCGLLLITSPGAPTDDCDPACPFATLASYPPNFSVAVHTDQAGHFYCDWTDYCHVVSPSEQYLKISGLASAPGITGAETLNGYNGFGLSQMGLDPDNPCAFAGTSPGWHTIRTWSIGGITFPVQITIGGPPSWSIIINLFGGQSGTVYLESPTKSGCEFISGIPLSVRSTGGYAGWLDLGGASFMLEPFTQTWQIKPVFDAQNRLTHIELRKRYNTMEPLTYLERPSWDIADSPADCAALVAGTTVSGEAVWGITTVSVPVSKISRASIGTGDIRVTGPLGYDEVATFVSADQAVDAGTITATYSIPPPEGNIWAWQWNGTYTVSMVASQVADLAGNYVAAGTLGTFLCSIAGESILVPLRLAGYLMAEVETLRFSLRLADNSAFDDDATPTVQILTTAGTLVAPTSGPVNIGGGYYSVTVTQAVHFPGPGELRLQAVAAGCQLVDEPYWSGPVPADEQAIDGDPTAAEYNRRDLTIGYSHGEVVADTDYEYDYGYGYGSGGCTPTETVFCVRGLELRETSTEVGNTGLYTLGYARRYCRLEYEPKEGETLGESRMVIVLKSQPLGDYTQLTVDRAELPEAPPAGTRITIGGYSAPEQAEA